MSAFEEGQEKKNRVHRNSCREALLSAFEKRQGMTKYQVMPNIFKEMSIHSSLSDIYEINNEGVSLRMTNLIDPVQAKGNVDVG